LGGPLATVVLISVLVPGCTRVKLLTRNDTVKDGLTVWFVFRVAPDPGERIVMPHVGEQGVAAPYAWGVSEGIPTRKIAIRSGTVINRLWLFIFLRVALWSKVY
jgi:hypothetical protein